MSKKNLIKDIIRKKIAEDNCRASSVSLNNLKSDLVGVFEKYAELDEKNFLLKAKFLQSGDTVFELKCSCKNFFF